MSIACRSLHLSQAEVRARFFHAGRARRSPRCPPAPRPFPPLTHQGLVGRWALSSSPVFLMRYARTAWGGFA